MENKNVMADTDKIVNQKLKLISEFYGISVLESNLYTDFPRLCFLRQGQFLIALFNAHKVLFPNDEISEERFVYSLDETSKYSIDEYSIDVMVRSVEKLYLLIKKDYDDECSPPKAHVLAWYALNEYWGNMSDEVYERFPLTHLKFQICALVCLGIREPIIDAVAETNKGSEQAQLLNDLIQLHPELYTKLRALERISGISRATISRLRKAGKIRTAFSHQKIKRQLTIFNWTEEKYRDFLISQVRLAQLKLGLPLYKGGAENS
jgi:hypothetical protein